MPKKESEADEPTPEPPIRSRPLITRRINPPELPPDLPRGMELFIRTFAEYLVRTCQVSPEQAAIEMAEYEQERAAKAEAAAEQARRREAETLGDQAAKVATPTPELTPLPATTEGVIWRRKK